jgi:hypothetical protein
MLGALPQILCICVPHGGPGGLVLNSNGCFVCLQELGKQNPQLLQMINGNQQEFLRLLNEPAPGGQGAVAADLASQLAAAVAPEGKPSRSKHCVGQELWRMGILKSVTQDLAEIVCRTGSVNSFMR